MIGKKPDPEPTSDVRISKDCFRVWCRHDANGLDEFKSALQTPRQKWPEPTV